MIRGARQLLTLRGPATPRRGNDAGNLAVIEDGSVLIENGIISNVGPTRRVENLGEARNAEVIEAHGKVVMPGFVDSHTHLVAGSPGLDEETDELSAQTGLADGALREIRDRPARSLFMRAQRIVEAAVRHGTTSMESKSGHGLNQSSELKVLKLYRSLNANPASIIPTYFGAYRTPAEFDSPAAYIDWICSELLPVISARKLAAFAGVCCAPEGFDIALARKYLNAAAQLGLPGRVDAEQSAWTGATQLAVLAGAASADGLNYIGEADIQALAKSNTIATVLPAPAVASECLPPARALIDAGAAVALASGYNSAEASTYSMQTAIAAAQRSLGMTLAEAITAATINGAHALRIAAKTGSLEYGKEADLILLEVSDYREIAYHFGVNLVALTISKGDVLYRVAEVACPAR